MGVLWPWMPRAFDEAAARREAAVGFIGCFDVSLKMGIGLKRPTHGVKAAVTGRPF
jgi:hypothetical protein